MAVRAYLMPIIVTTNPVSGLETRAPKYTFEGIDSSGVDYGIRPVYLFFAEVTPAQHSSIVANADVSAFPANLDATTGANRQAVENALEGYGLPGAWVTTSTTYRAVLRVILGSCLIAKQYRRLAREEGADPDLLPDGITLGTPYSDMPADYRDRLERAVVAAEYTIPDPVPQGATIRDLLRTVGQQAAPATFLGLTI